MLNSIRKMGFERTLNSIRKVGIEHILNIIRKIGFERPLNSNRKMGFERMLKPKVWLRILTVIMKLFLRCNPSIFHIHFS